VAPGDTEAALSHLRAAGEAAFRIGQLVPANGEAEVTLQGTLGL
jgi:hypothetical protein